jgi:hypothetical protein
MKTVIMAAISLLMASGFAFAQQDPDDPGAQDSIIIGTVYVDSGATEVQVPVYLFADDSVVYINSPISWNTTGGINPIDVIDMNQHDCLTIRDSIFADHILIIGSADLPDTSCRGPFPNNHRLNLFSIVFDIAPAAPGQQVLIDTTWDDRTLSTIFGLTDGLTEITPAIVEGYIFYNPTGIQDDGSNLPSGFTLSQNYPNPFNPSTNIAFSLNGTEKTSLVIYDLLGRQIRMLVNEHLDAGDYIITWDGRNGTGAEAPSGTYFYRLAMGDNTLARKMTLVR